MILTTHAVIGAAAAQLLPQNPFLAFIAGFLSHFAADAIPHWDYDIAALKRERVLNPRFLTAAAKVGIDLAFGIILSLLFFYSSDPYFRQIILIGALSGALPDALQFVTWKLPREPLLSLHRFHSRIHTKKKMRRPFVGILSQAVIIATIKTLFRVFDAANS